MPAAPLLLLPPSEGKAPGGRGRPLAVPRLSFPSLVDHRNTVIDALASTMRGSVAARAALLGVKGDALAHATDANRAIRTGPTMAAIDRFTGVLYDALDVESLTARDRKRLDAQVIIFSGVFGLLSPRDAIPDHRLKMTVSLPRIGKVGTSWKPLITDALASRVAGATVWNLLPNEHAATWKPATVGSPGGPAAMLSVRFLDEKPPAKGARQFTTVSHWNKLLKGALVRFVLATGADEPAALTRFRHPEGYVFDPSLTEESGGTVLISMVRPVG